MGNKNIISTANFIPSVYTRHNLFLIEENKIEENKNSYVVIDEWKREGDPHFPDDKQQTCHRYTTEREAWKKFVALIKVYSKLYPI